MIKPKKLKPGDKLGLIATSGVVAPKRLAAAIGAVKAMGFKVELGRSAAAAEGYLAGPDQLRARDIMEMFCRKDIDGILTLRGGYGAHRLINLLDFDLIAENPKFFAGYSDVTALHMVFNQRCKFITYHTPMAASEFYKGVDDYTMASFLKVAFSEKAAGLWQNPPCCMTETLHKGKAQGQSIGGNLRLVTSTLGTEYEIDTTGKILFLEEVGEAAYRIDSMLNQLKNSKKLEKAAGFALGGFTDCEAANGFDIKKLFCEYLPKDKPTLCNLAFGHVLPVASFPLGAMVNIDTYTGKLEFLNF